MPFRKVDMKIKKASLKLGAVFQLFPSLFKAQTVIVAAAANLVD